MKVLSQKGFAVFTLFRMSAKLFNMNVQDGAVLVAMDLRESMRDSTKVFS